MRAREGDARTRRLRTDYGKVAKLLERAGDALLLESETGDPVHQYVFVLRTRSLARLEGPDAVFSEEHRFSVKIPAGYPLEPPAVRILTPIFHPHVFASGVVCLGSRWQVGEGLDRLLVRLEALLRFDPAYLDLDSPANLDAVNWTRAHWAAFPLCEPALVLEG